MNNHQILMSGIARINAHVAVDAAPNAVPACLGDVTQDEWNQAIGLMGTTQAMQLSVTVLRRLKVPRSP